MASTTASECDKTVPRWITKIESLESVRYPYLSSRAAALADWIDPKRNIARRSRSNRNRTNPLQRLQTPSKRTIGPTDDLECSNVEITLPRRRLQLAQGCGRSEIAVVDVVRMFG
jgi:hypothetical protein